MGEPLTWAERLESLKAGLVCGGTAAVTEGLFQVLQSQFSSGPGTVPGFQLDPVLLGDLAIAGFSGFLFGVTCRYAIRQDHNPHLSSGVVLAFGLVRGLAQLNLEDATVQMFPLLMFAIFESIGLFAIAYLSLSFAIQRGWIKPCL
jgi:hypothetical protein